jgi:putative transcriptional regulator
MSEAFEQIARGLNEAIRFAEGDTTGAVIHEVRISDTDVKAIRAATGLNQQAFATSIGVAVGTLRGWEQNRRRPDGPARVLLALIGKNPALVQQYLVTS